MKLDGKSGSQGPKRLWNLKYEERKWINKRALPERAETAPNHYNDSTEFVKGLNPPKLD